MAKGTKGARGPEAKPYAQQDGDGNVRLRVHVKPDARADRIAGVDPWRAALVVEVAAPALQGKANARLVEVLAERLSVKKPLVQVVSGLTSREKVVLVHAIDLRELRMRLEGGP